MIVAEYACGGWIAQTPLPPTEAAIYKSITTIQNYNDGILTQILQNNNYAKVRPTYSLGYFSFCTIVCLPFPHAVMPLLLGGFSCALGVALTIPPGA